MEIVGGLAGFILLESTHSVVTSKLHETMMFYNKTTHITHIWDGLQTSMSCCGSYDAMTDYQNCTASEPTVYKNPCYESLSKIIKENASTLSGMAIGIAFLQLLGIVLSCSLSKSMRDTYKSI